MQLPPIPPAAGGRLPSPAPPPGGAWLFGRYRLEPDSRRLWIGERSRELDARALAVLVCLLRRAGDVVPRGTLMAEAWPEAEVVFDSAVSKVMRRLRLALDDGHGHLLQTIYGEGYRLAVPAVLLPPAPRLNGASPEAAHAVHAAHATHAAHAGAPPATAQPAAPATDSATATPLRRRWLARLPWIIAVAATLVALVLGWLLAGRGAA